MNVFKAAAGFILFVVVFIIVMWLLIGTLLVKGCKAVQKDGLKGVATQVWEGPSTNK